MVNGAVIKLDNGRYAKKCPSCKVEQTYLRKAYAQESLRLGKLCKVCSNKITNNTHRGWHRGVRLSWYTKFMTGAKTRGICWHLTIDDVADLMESQGGKCALTGWPIEFPQSGHPQRAPASIDRISSDGGYTRENVQLVIRHVNMMKQSYDNDYFIAVCVAVADKAKW